MTNPETETSFGEYLRRISREKFPFLPSPGATNPVNHVKIQWGEIDNYDIGITGRVKIEDGVISGFEQETFFPLYGDRIRVFLLWNENQPDGDKSKRVFSLLVSKFDSEGSLVGQRLAYYNFQEKGQDEEFDDVISRDQGREVELGVRPLPDSLNLTAVVGNVIVGNFALQGIWEPTP